MRLIINSAKLNSTNTLSFYLPNEVTNIKSFKLISCSIPYSFFNVTTSNNQFLINNVSFTIPIQNYNYYQLATAINTVITVSTGVSISTNRQSYKYTFTASTSFTFNALNMGIVLGFVSQYAYSSSFNGTTQSITGPNVADSSNGIRSLYITSRKLNSNVIENSITNNQIIYAIPISKYTFGSMIYYENPTDIFISVSRLQQLDFQICDSNFNLINFNGLTSEFTFEILSTSDDVEYDLNKVNATESLFLN